jgi:uncharacterized membrane protein YgcG
MKSWLPLSILIIIVSLLLVSTCAAQDAERILLFQSAITVHQDSTMTVQETIKVVAAGNQIKHGIYRDFPTVYRDKQGRNYVVGFSVQSVTRDGAAEPYAVEGLSNGKRVKMGSADVTIEPGRHTYVITYKADNLLGFFDDHDELYWNVTGTGWGFSMDQVVAIVKLPGQVKPKDIRLEAYTGPEGSTDKNYQAHTDASGRAIFRTTKPLAPNENLTIVVGWPKGIVQEPSRQEKAAHILKSNLGLFLAVIGLLAALLYYLAVWSKVGRDPKKGTIIPIYEPPDGISPAAMRFIRRMGYDNKAFAAALIDMGVKRYVKIEEEKGVYTISEYHAENSSLLSPEEQGAAVKLMEDGPSIVLKTANHTNIAAAITAVKTSLSSSYGKGYFARNTAYMIPAVIISAVALIAAAMSMPPDRAALMIFWGVWITGWTFGLFAMLNGVIRAWKASSTPMGCFGAGCTSAAAIPFFIFEVVGVVLLITQGTPLFAFLAIALGFINVLFYQLLKAPTAKGRALMDKIEGFRLYMSVAEKDELNTMNPPEKTPEVFEKYLPYALALDVEQEWALKFAAVLAAATAAGTAYQPDWYSGRAFSGVYTGAALSSFTSSIGSSLSGAVASSSVAPGSSSGFSSGGGGGGSSGGGGGGGGGGGW